MIPCRNETFRLQLERTACSCRLHLPWTRADPDDARHRDTFYLVFERPSVGLIMMIQADASGDDNIGYLIINALQKHCRISPKAASIFNPRRFSGRLSLRCCELSMALRWRPHHRRSPVLYGVQAPARTPQRQHILYLFYLLVDYSTQSVQAFSVVGRESRLEILTGVSSCLLASIHT